MLFVNPESHVYKTVGTLELKADVYRSFQTSRESPALLWFHGGGLVDGSRKWLTPAQANWFLREGFTVVAADYRLAPNTLLPDILQDVDDVFAWLHDKGHGTFLTDPRRIVAAGRGAGGFLALALGCRKGPQPKPEEARIAARDLRLSLGFKSYQETVRPLARAPRPAGILCFGGFGDLSSPDFARPGRFYDQLPPVDRDEALRLVQGPPLAESHGERLKHYLHCRQNGCWPQAVAGEFPAAGAAAYRPFSPLWNIGPGFPPTLLLHGELDKDIPAAHSELLAEELARLGVDARALVLPGVDEDFDEDLDSPAARTAFAAVSEFVAKLDRPPPRL